MITGQARAKKGYGAISTISFIRRKNRVRNAWWRKYSTI
jgi:hypothetical protein